MSVSYVPAVKTAHGPASSRGTKLRTGRADLFKINELLLNARTMETMVIRDIDPVEGILVLERGWGVTKGKPIKMGDELLGLGTVFGDIERPVKHRLSQLDEESLNSRIARWKEIVVREMQNPNAELELEVQKRGYTWLHKNIPLQIQPLLKKPMPDYMVRNWIDNAWRGMIEPKRYPSWEDIGVRKIHWWMRLDESLWTIVGVAVISYILALAMNRLGWLWPLRSGPR